MDYRKEIKRIKQASTDAENALQECSEEDPFYTVLQNTLHAINILTRAFEDSLYNPEGRP